MTPPLTGKVALVTGAAKGIGAGIAKAMAAAGASVVVNFATDRPGAERVVADIKAAGGDALATQANFSGQINPAAVDTEGARAIGAMSDEARAAQRARTELGPRRQFPRQL